MASNGLTYIDRKEGATLTNKDLNKMVWRSLFLQGSFNYERMQAGGWLFSILPGLKKIHTNKDDLSASMKHNLEFFNTHPFLITFVMGIVLSLNRKKQTFKRFVLCVWRLWDHLEESGMPSSGLLYFQSQLVLGLTSHYQEVSWDQLSS